MDTPKLKAGEVASGESLIKLATSIDQYERYARPHASQMARYAEAIALRIGLAGEDVNAIKLAALLHDVGELAVDMQLVRTAGVIDFRQRIELWRHPIIGEQQAAKRGLARHIQLLIRWHHEWWNGMGYPDMLTGATIPVGARIIRLIDTFDALTSWRPYRAAYGEDEALEIVTRAAGQEFDPFLVTVFLEMMAELRAEEEAARRAAAPPVTELPIAEPPIAEPLVAEPEATTDSIGTGTDSVSAGVSEPAHNIERTETESETDGENRQL